MIKAVSSEPTSPKTNSLSANALVQLQTLAPNLSRRMGWGSRCRHQRSTQQPLQSPRILHNPYTPHIIDIYLHLFIHAYVHILHSLLSVSIHSYMHVRTDSYAFMHSHFNSDKPSSVSYGPRISNVLEGKKSGRHLHPGISMLGGREARASQWCVTRIQDGGCCKRAARQGLEPQNLLLIN